MQKLAMVFWGICIAVTGLWLMADSPIPDPLNYFSLRRIYVQYTGIVSIIMFAIAVLLALRPKVIERPLNGLDKMYRLHKWLGIGGLSFAVIHWWLALGSKWMVGWGWLDKPARRQRGAPDFTGIEQWLHQQRGLAESIGEWAFYAAAVLIVLALLKTFPYFWFRKTHKLLAVAFLALAWHSLVLIDSRYWSQPLFWVTAVLVVAGAVASVLVLLGRVGRTRQVNGVIDELNYYPGVKVIEGTVLMEPGWPGHQAGQFAFVTSKEIEGAHPYTIASAWDEERHTLTFIVKSLGDWTQQLPDLLQVGTSVKVEGPYGCFNFEDTLERQIWVGAGIGITPFIAAMKYRVQNPSPQEVDLFHTTHDFDQAAIDKLTADAKAANIRLHLWVSSEDGRLTPEQIRALVPGWKDSSIWFCGPLAFGAALRRDFIRHGLAPAHFHQELFEMR